MLIRAVARVEAGGKLSIPNNIRRQAGLRAGQLVELRVVGVSNGTRLLLSRRGRAAMTGRGR